MEYSSARASPESLSVLTVPAPVKAGCNHPQRNYVMAQDVKVGREILPIPDQPYRGAVPFDARAASAPPQAMLHAPEGAPNVVIVLVDDMGFGIPSAFGGFVNMPATDRLAKGGLRYNHMHTTALCSPTRAALLTGRNHHSVNMGSITEFATSWPRSNGIIPNTCANTAPTLNP